ncbi:hypothetical protein ID866_7442 [Astraeus odoratus]|nr:hypothetical protein ID866_7442 [Astraeus odoratus]
MVDVENFGANANQASTSQSAPQSRPNGQASSGITLVLPSLKALKAAKAVKKSKLRNVAAGQDGTEAKKIPRPIKLKPLREVLSKLISQIKKKDDYAFFLNPVDPEQVPGYAEAIKHPMDFGTMTSKVDRGKYRSLEEFSSDFRLVIDNAKTFNPPGSIYYNEAERIETWGLEQISKSSAHVIEYETNWNIEIEAEDDPTPVNVEDDTSTPRDVDGSMTATSPAPSATPAPTNKRGPRGSRKNAQLTISESLDAEGRLPGSKDGVGAFPPASDWAELMIALKIKGKRYRTKRERLRFEKEGPPYCPDGSVDYREMEDPFSVLNVFVPDPPSRPQVTPLYPSLPADSPYQPPNPGVILLPANRPPPYLNTPDPPRTKLHLGKTVAPPIIKRRHWTIVRNASARSRLSKETSEHEEDPTATITKTPREALPVDWGTFAQLLGILAADSDPIQRANACGSEHRLHEALRSSIALKPSHSTSAPTSTTAFSPVHGPAGGDERTANEFWTDTGAAEGWDYITDVVYGGVDGYAYVRSLAEFLRPPPEFEPPSDPAMPLGVPVARYVEDHLVDPITHGRHSLLRDVFRATYDGSLDPAVTESVSDPHAHLYPGHDSSPITTHTTNTPSLISPSKPISSNFSQASSACIARASASRDVSPPLPPPPLSPASAEPGQGQPQSVVPSHPPPAHSPDITHAPTHPDTPSHLPYLTSSSSPCPYVPPQTLPAILHMHVDAPGMSPGLARILTLPSASSLLATFHAPLDMAALLNNPDELARASMLEPVEAIEKHGSCGVVEVGEDGEDQSFGGEQADGVCMSDGDGEQEHGDMDIDDAGVDESQERASTGGRERGPNVLDQGVPVPPLSPLPQPQPQPQVQAPAVQTNSVLAERDAIERALLWSAHALEELHRLVLSGHGSKEGTGVERSDDERSPTRAEEAVKKEEEEGAGLTLGGSTTRVDKTETDADTDTDGAPMDVDVEVPSPETVDQPPPTDEDPFLKRVRLNLVALAKRAPLDKIARLPAELVPESIRGMVPTI